MCGLGTPCNEKQIAVGKIQQLSCDVLRYRHVAPGVHHKIATLMLEKLVYLLS